MATTWGGGGGIVTQKGGGRGVQAGAEDACGEGGEIKERTTGGERGRDQAEAEDVRGELWQWWAVWQNNENKGRYVHKLSTMSTTQPSGPIFTQLSEPSQWRCYQMKRLRLARSHLPPFGKSKKYIAHKVVNWFSLSLPLSLSLYPSSLSLNFVLTYMYPPTHWYTCVHLSWNEMITLICITTLSLSLSLSLSLTHSLTSTCMYPPAHSLLTFSPSTHSNTQHHCHKCGGVFCGACSAKRFPLLEQGYSDPVRVCKRCYTVLTKNNSS